MQAAKSFQFEDKFLSLLNAPALVPEMEVASHRSSMSKDWKGMCGHRHSRPCPTMDTLCPRNLALQRERDQDRNRETRCLQLPGGRRGRSGKTGVSILALGGTRAFQNSRDRGEVTGRAEGSGKGGGLRQDKGAGTRGRLTSCLHIIFYGAIFRHEHLSSAISC